MPSVLIAALKQETATFNPTPTCYDDFRIHRGEELLRAYTGTQTELAGAMDAFAEHGDIRLTPILSAMSVSGGRIVTADLDRLLEELVDGARQNSDVDAAYLCLHGAMAGQDEGDPEGRLLTEVRAALGDRPLVASLDLHAVVSDRLVAAADVLVPFHTYPHVDQYETGRRAARVLLRMLDGKVRPVTARVRLPMLVRGDELITATGRFGQAIRQCQQVEASPAGLAAGVIIGNAFTDVPDLQSNVLITTDDQPQVAAEAAQSVARFMWENRNLFQADLTPLDEAVALAEATAGLTVFSDAADATASGAAGDSNAILRELLDVDFRGTALVPIVDAPAVAAAVQCGIGGSREFHLGGTRDPGRFQPLALSATVKSLHDGQFTYEDGTAAKAGRAAVLSHGGIRLLVTERPVYVVGRRVFQAHGLEPQDFDVVVVKSPNGFRTWYESIAARIVPVDAPGSTSANLKSLPFENCVRPSFPLDGGVKPSFEVELKHASL